MAAEEAVAAAAVHGAEEELLPCPICFKTCNSRLDLDAHMDTHPDTALRYTNTHASSSQMNTVLLHDVLTSFTCNGRRSKRRNETRKDSELERRQKVQALLHQATLP